MSWSTYLLNFIKNLKRNIACWPGFFCINSLSQRRSELEKSESKKNMTESLMNNFLTQKTLIYIYLGASLLQKKVVCKHNMCSHLAGKTN